MKEVRTAKDTYAAFWRSQKPFAKLRFRIWAAFGKGAYTCLDTQVKHEQPAQSTSYAVRMAQKNASKKGKKKQQKPVQMPFVKPDRPLPVHEEEPQEPAYEEPVYESPAEESPAPERRRRRRSDHP